MPEHTFDPLSSSFRDPAGYLFRDSDGLLYRKVSAGYQEAYERLMHSGLYETLIKKELLIKHKELAESEAAAYCYTLQPEEVPFISYPYEWSFSQLKDAALLTLQVQAEAMAYGMSLKDASAYNILYHKGKPVFVDTLSFDIYNEGTPWIAYRQFCQHFLAPLALAIYKTPALTQLLLSHIDGIPLDIASKLLPARSYLSFGLMLHIHLHAKAQAKFNKKDAKAIYRHRTVGKQAILNLISSLRDTVESLKWQPGKSVWASYYEGDNNNYSGRGMGQKEQVVEALLSKINSTTLWDLGANTGRFSKIAAKKAKHVIATDFDPAAVELLYRDVRENQIPNIHPLITDVTNPSPGIGWLNKERIPFLDRVAPDTVLALAIVHHLLFSHNIPLSGIVKFFANCCEFLIVEFVPKEDSQVQLLLKNKTDILPHYSKQYFEDAFRESFLIAEAHPIADSSRVIYLMRRK